MKKFFSSLLILSLFFSQNFLQVGEVFADENGLEAQFTWDSTSFEGVTKLEFILDLKGSILEQGILANKKRLSKKSSESGYDIIGATNVNKYEEKLVLRLTGVSGQYIDFVNFDTTHNVKKFHDIALIQHNGKIKAKVVIYIHKDIDAEVYNVLTNSSVLSLKSAKYLYFGIKSGKPYKKARAIKIN